ncbi:MAG: hypothetical protein CTY20_03395 [Hyphomicrobium sp.]|nr:MAG: hypothetical protein CTY20_03395 [Hyphomicrobium sp.]
MRDYRVDHVVRAQAHGSVATTIQCPHAGGANFKEAIITRLFMVDPRDGIALPCVMREQITSIQSRTTCPAPPAI